MHQGWLLICLLWCVRCFVRLFRRRTECGGIETQSTENDRKEPKSEKTQAERIEAEEGYRRRVAGIMTPGLGLYNAFKEPRSLNVRIEYRTPWKFWAIQPLIGMTYNTQIDFYGYIGLAFEFFITDRVFFQISGAVGYYRYGGKGLDLGYPLEFREGFELGYRFNKRYHIAVTIYHMSNSTLGETNPGQESISLSFGFPLFVDSALDQEPDSSQRKRSELYRAEYRRHAAVPSKPSVF
jgi:hypothetical protein